MNERTYRFADDKTGWGDGPWQAEPDKVVWVDDATGLDCMIVRNQSGALCGYVGVPEDHPWFEVDYDSIDDYPDVHGGLTFANHCQPGAREDEHVICHNDEGRPANVWWLGFDCAHAWDAMPGIAARERALGLPEGAPGLTSIGWHDVYRDLAYVTAEVTRLAEQAAAAQSVCSHAGIQCLQPPHVSDPRPRPPQQLS